MRLSVDYMDLDSLFEQFQEKVPDCEKLTRNEVKQFEAIFYRLAEVSNGGWISVKDRLPDPNNFVLTIDKLGFFYMDSVNKNGKWDEQDGGFNPVTHWMPLPEPPKEEV